MQRRDKGFTLIELIIALAIMVAIMGVGVITTASLVTNSQRSTNQNIVLNEVQNAGYWISRDVQMAKTVALNEPRGFPLTLVISVGANPDNDYSISYFFDGNNLKRQANGSPEMPIARYIDVEDTTFSTVDSNAYRLTIKASEGEAIIERRYEISQRIGSGG